MLKRAAEDQDGPEAKKAPSGGKGAAAGMRADDVTNPIPRLFKQNSITIHITQRTFEEIGPGELKWIPTCQYYAAMFDRFHARQFENYYKRCSTFQITDPKIRISNVLMLQDEQTTSSGTPKDVSVFTQACYLMHYQPRGIKNWFKLGTTTDCMRSQTYLTYKPMEATECKVISQLVTVGKNQYQDFETLVINPAKADFYAGWHTGETNAATKDPTSLDCQLLEAIEGEINVDETKLQDNVNYYVTECFISPRSPYLGEFSCSVKGCEPHIELSKHTTYARNLDKINLHKYGDSFGFHINTNLEGVQMLKHDANNPFGHKFLKSTKSSPKADTEIKTVFCYPSDNRPFFSRFNNFDPNGPVDANKGLGGLTHHFFTMPPIKKNDGTLIKQRCSFIMEQSMSITFHFPETVTEDSAEDMLQQRDAVVLRPAIVSMKKNPKPESPKPPAYHDFVRDKIRDVIRDVATVVLPVAGSSGFQNRPIGSQIPILNKRWSLPAHLGALCGQIGLEPVCSDVSAIIKRGVGNQPTLIDWDTIGSYFADPPKPITETELIDGVIIPKVNWPYTLRDKQLEDVEITQMNDHDLPKRNRSLGMFLFWDFLFYLKKNNALDLPYNHVDNELPDDVYESEGNQLSERILSWLKPETDNALEIIFQEKCVEKVMRLYPDRLRKFTIWNRDGSNDWNRTVLADFKSLNTSAKEYPVDFNIQDWIHYLWQMRLWVMPKYDQVSHMMANYNWCILEKRDAMYPRVPLTPEQIQTLKDLGLLPKDSKPFKVEDIDEIKDDWYKYETSMFFV